MSNDAQRHAVEAFVERIGSQAARRLPRGARSLPPPTGTALRPAPGPAAPSRESRLVPLLAAAAAALLSVAGYWALTPREQPRPVVTAPRTVTFRPHPAARPAAPTPQPQVAAPARFVASRSPIVGAEHAALSGGRHRRPPADPIAITRRLNLRELRRITGAARNAAPRAAPAASAADRRDHEATRRLNLRERRRIVRALHARIATSH